MYPIKIYKYHVSVTNTYIFSWVGWNAFVVPATQKAEAGEPLEPRIQD
jgi:hypothetical protein